MSPSLRQKLESGTFVITAEVCPPKGCDCRPFIATASTLRQTVDAINVTDNQGANMRISPVTAASLLVREGIEPILQLTCRDRNRLALQSELLGAAACGVTNLLALTGDHISFGDHKGAKGVFDLDSVQLLQLATRLNNGQDLEGNGLNGRTDFFLGAAAAPEAEPFQLSLMKIGKKARAGASFLQTQAMFDPQRLRLFAEAVAPSGLKIIAGILLLKSSAMARYVNRTIPGLSVPQELIDELDQTKNQLDKGCEIAARMATEFLPYCHGLHVMAMGREDVIPQVLSGLPRVKQ
jgi:5,10-methylenetetrahydrofolate reductase